MTAFLSADTTAMRHLAQRIRQASAQIGQAEPAALRPAVAALAAPVLVQATGVFLERWAETLTDLADDAHRLADLIDLTAQTYQDADAVIQTGMSR
jgi:hypothetical protein